jgi:hypothetical protein
MTTMLLALLGSSSSPSPEVFVSGVSASGAVGFVGSQGSVTFSVAGVSASGQTGSVTQSLGASVNVTGVAATGAVGSVEAQPLFELPEGAILLFDRASTGTAIPSGFSLYTEENGQSVTGFLIKGGTAVSRDTGTTAPVTYTGGNVTSGAAGAHGPGVFNFTAETAGTPSPSSLAYYDAPAGSHSHTVSISGSATYPASATIQGTSVPLIRASSESATIPANAIVFGTSSGGFTGFSSKSWGVNGVYSIASSVNGNNPAPTSVAPSFSLSTSSDGEHTHLRFQSGRGPSPTPGAHTVADVSSGTAHTHPGGTFGLVGVWKQFRHLLPFVSTGSSEVQSGMIIMYNGVSAPSGWKICDGTNGTPDMVGFFLGFNSGSSGGALVGRDVIGSSGPTATTPAPPPSAYGTTSVPVTMNPSPWFHTHGRTTPIGRMTTTYTAFHLDGSAPHTHTVPSITMTMPNAYMPRNLTLIFLQKE